MKESEGETNVGTVMNKVSDEVFAVKVEFLRRKLLEGLKVDD